MRIVQLGFLSKISFLREAAKIEIKIDSIKSELNLLKHLLWTYWKSYDRNLLQTTKKCRRLIQICLSWKLLRKNLNLLRSKFERPSLAKEAAIFCRFLKPCALLVLRTFLVGLGEKSGQNDPSFSMRSEVWLQASFTWEAAIVSNLVLHSRGDCGSCRFVEKVAWLALQSAAGFGGRAAFHGRGERVWDCGDAGQLLCLCRARGQEVIVLCQHLAVDVWFR